MPLGPEGNSSISPFLRKHLRSHAEAAEEIRRGVVEKLKVTMRKEIESALVERQKNTGANGDVAPGFLKIAPKIFQRRDSLPKS